MARSITRRTFVQAASVAALSAGGCATQTAKTAATAAAGAKLRSLGANDRIGLGVIGVGGRGSGLLSHLVRRNKQKGDVEVLAVCEIYDRRKERAKKIAQDRAQVYHTYEDMLERDDIDAVVIATPDHWHAKITMDALNKKKDVYCEKPMTHTLEEAYDVWKTVEKTGGVMQVGSQTTSQDHWHKCRKCISDGMIGRLVMSQGSYHRNSVGGEWNYGIDKDANEQNLDWQRFLGPAPSRPFEPERYFRFRKFWDYSGGIATDLFYHVLAPLNLTWADGPQFPYRILGHGGRWIFKDREVPDTFTLAADYAAGHSVILTSSMANDVPIPGTIRGHKATIQLVPHGRFEAPVKQLDIVAQDAFKKEFRDKYGAETVTIKTEPREDHMSNFLSCIRSRQTPVANAYMGYKCMVAIDLAVRSHRFGKVYYFDEKNHKVLEGPTSDMPV